MIDPDNLPDRYKPESLRPVFEDVRQQVVTYAIGFEEKPMSYGMAYGPTPDLKEMLDTIPKDKLDANAPLAKRQAVLIRHNLDGTHDLIYVWFAEVGGGGGVWVKIQPGDY